MKAIGLLAITVMTVPAALAQGDSTWRQPFDPLRIVGNIYYVGTRGLSSFRALQDFRCNARRPCIIKVGEIITQLLGHAADVATGFSQPPPAARSTRFDALRRVGI